MKKTETFTKKGFHKITYKEATQALSLQAVPCQKPKGNISARDPVIVFRVVLLHNLEVRQLQKLYLEVRQLQKFFS